MSNVFHAKAANFSYIKNIRTTGNCSEAFLLFLISETTKTTNNEIDDIKWQDLAIKFD